VVAVRSCWGIGTSTASFALLGCEQKAKSMLVVIQPSGRLALGTVLAVAELTAPVAASMPELH